MCGTSLFFIHSSADGQLGCFHALTVVSSAAMNIGVRVYFQIRVSSIYMPRNGIAGSYGKGILLGRKAMTNLDCELKSRDITC